MAKNELDLQMEDYQYLPLRDVVFRTLRQAILRGELKPGAVSYTHLTLPTTSRV